MTIILKKGDKFQESFREFLRRNRVNSGFFFGLGAVTRPELAFYDLTKKKYLKKKFPGLFEVLSITGNVAQSGEGVAVHAHVVLGNDKFQAIGGHLVDAVIGGTLEINLIESGLMERRLDDETGLNLLK